MAKWDLRISKKKFYELGGFSNSLLYRNMVNGAWTYWQIID
jgi:hypothetical protein